MTLYVLGSLALLSGAIALSAGLLGLYRRHGGGGPLAIAGMSVLAVGGCAPSSRSTTRSRRWSRRGARPRSGQDATMTA